jgi:hypothetical protein
MKGNRSKSFAVGLCKIKLDMRHETKMTSGTYIVWVFVKTGLNKVLKVLGVGACQLWWIVFWNEEENSHRVQLGIWWLSFG